jgi:hypothetical protein
MAEGFDLEWLKTVLEEENICKKNEWVDYSMVRIAEGVGFLSTLHRIDIKLVDPQSSSSSSSSSSLSSSSSSSSSLSSSSSSSSSSILSKNQRTISFVLKDLPEHDETASFCTTFGIHAAELAFFQQIKKGNISLARVASYLPCPIAIADPKLLMNFCSGCPGSIASPISSSHYQAILHILAQLHSIFWVLSPEELHTQADWLKTFNETETCQLLEESIQSAKEPLKLIEEEIIRIWPELKAVAEMGFQQWLTSDEIKKIVERCVGNEYQGPRTIIHGDLWCGNILFDPHPSTLLDWQFTKYAHPLIDLALLLCSSCDPQDYLTTKQRELLFEPYLQTLSQFHPSLAHDWTFSHLDSAFLHILPYIWLIMAASASAWVFPHTLSTMSARYAALLRLVFLAQ